jgi:hypothetical protein
VWEEEGEIDGNLFPDKIWLDKFDVVSRHWIVYLRNCERKGNTTEEIKREAEK